MKRLVLVAMAMLFVVGFLGNANAETEGNVYSNEFVGLRFSIPEGWYIVTDNETKELVQDGARVMGLDDPAAKAIAAKIPGKVLLIVSEYPLNSDIQRFNHNIAFVAINVREIKDEIRSGADYLGHVERGWMEQQGATVSDIIKQTMAGDEFHRLNVRFPMQGITVYSCQLARVHNDYVVILNMSASNDASLDALVQIADSNMILSAVPQEVDSSPEGQSFREKSSLDISGSSRNSSSGGNFLETLGIILMIGGAIWLLKSIFR